MKSLLAAFLLLLAVSIFSAEASVMISPYDDHIEISVTLQDFISQDIEASLQAGEGVIITYEFFKKGFLSKKVYSTQKVEFKYDILNNKFSLKTGGEVLYFKNFDDLVDEVATFRASFDRELFEKERIFCRVHVKGMSVVGVFAIIYKVFFDLNYSMEFLLEKKL
ncbi:hypothetical protein KAJ26_02390 [bacterium]|nr:hypothetical protein [bacterium]